MRLPKLYAFCLCILSGPAAAGAASWSVSLSPSEVAQGGVQEIQVSGEDIQTVQGSLREREIPFFPQRGSLIALVGVDLEAKPGAVPVAIEVLGKSGEKTEKVVTLRVREKAFPQEKISVPPSFDRLDQAMLKRIAREQEELNRLWAESSPSRLWTGPFVAPVPGGITSPFGFRRIVNGLPRAPHGGVDLKAALGAEVVAANDGRVVLEEELFFSGKSIVLDHGGGLYTMYFHLNDYHVRTGSWVRKGELLGWAGMTGRVTGPHLHWGVRLNRARVDPLALLDATAAMPEAKGNTRQAEHRTP